MSIPRTVVGIRSEERIHEIERGAIRRFAQATGDTNPIYLDRHAARAAGNEDVVAPPLFALALSAGSDVILDAGLDPRELLLLSHTVEVSRPLVVGESIRVVHQISDVRVTGTGVGRLELLVIDEMGKDGAGRDIFRARRQHVARAIP